MKKVLLTGISGYIGLHCATELLKQGYAVKGSIRNLSKAQALEETIKKHIDPKDPTNNCLDVAIITAPEKRTQKTKDKLKTVAGRVLNK